MKATEKRQKAEDFPRRNVLTLKAMVQEKADASIPVTTLSPPEGNTTFLDGTDWCVAHAGASQVDLQNALDWACGLGMADCGPIQSGGPCFNPNTLLSHASFAFNSYYQQNGNSDIACNFGGTATLTKNNPSYDKCVYAVPGSVDSSAPTLFKYRPNQIEIVDQGRWSGPTEHSQVFWQLNKKRKLLSMSWVSGSRSGLQISQ
ncbi:hypothetical protein RJ639_021173 [Escallonia herrerae]|uniref:X8 domain-containing protein n=1 Tax=Escallonia herrerae TaxID=1293975 RepID=A0AA88V3W5_9ASTE|nr:hypothetical protein RJ639_021173 [Escallonia herrerae]